MAGELRFRVMGVEIDCQTNSTAVPSMLEDVTNITSTAEYILVVRACVLAPLVPGGKMHPTYVCKQVEKDAVFQQLIMDSFHLRNPCIIITVEKRERGENY